SQRAVEARFALEQAVEGNTGKGAGARREVRVVFSPGKGRVQSGNERLDCVLRGVEEEIRFRHVVRRLSVGVDQLQQVSGEGESGDVAGSRKQLLEGRGLIALQGRARILRLKSFQLRALGEGLGQGKRNLYPTPRAEEQGVLRNGQQLVVGVHRLDSFGQFHFARAAYRAHRDSRDEASARTRKRDSRLAGRVLQHHHPRYEALRRGTVLLDCRFGNCGQAGVHRHRPCGFVSMGGGSCPSSYIADYLPIRQDVHLVSRKCL